MSERGKTIREAITVALEGLPGNLVEWAVIEADHKAMRAHVFDWVHDYAKNRGVILEDRDIESELKVIVAELRAKLKR